MIWFGRIKASKNETFHYVLIVGIYVVRVENCQNVYEMCVGQIFNSCPIIRDDQRFCRLPNFHMSSSDGGYRESKEFPVMEL